MLPKVLYSLRGTFTYVYIDPFIRLRFITLTEISTWGSKKGEYACVGHLSLHQHCHMHTPNVHWARPNEYSRFSFGQDAHDDFQCTARWLFITDGDTET